MSTTNPVWKLADYELEALMPVLKALKLDHLSLSDEVKCNLYSQHVSMPSSLRKHESTIAAYIRLATNRVNAMDRDEVQKTIAGSVELQEEVKLLAAQVANLLFQVPREGKAT